MEEKKKICTKCKDEKKISEFNKNKGKKDGYNNICRKCSNERSKQYYSENTNHHKAVIRKRRKAEIEENRRKLYQHYLDHPCVVCGETDPIVLQSDHMDGVDKKGVISNMVYSTVWGTIEKELKKCETRCANCHHRRTAKQQGWYKWLEQ